MSTSLSTVKNQLRQEFKQRREALSRELRHQASLQICNHIEAWEVFQQATTILSYLSFHSEVNLASLFERHPTKTWAIPRIIRKGQMVFQEYDPGKLVLHRFGMWEPARECPLIPPEEIQLILVPGMAFNLQGWRLGYGGGYYDRFLSKNYGSFVGVTFAALCGDEIPHEAHDIPMQFLVTENSLEICISEKS
jgi:5-formyltetrahydrofolate cyclo-ligase